MRRSAPSGRAGWTCAGAVALALVAATAAPAAPGDPERGVTPPSGPSLVSRIEAGVDWGSWGRAGMGDENVPAHTATGGQWLLRGFDLDGDDLFRLNCRACHGPEAKGSKSGIPPLYGALAPHKADPSGKPAPSPEIQVRHRLLAGGRVMPPFGHLEADEVGALVGYLYALRDGKPTPKTKVHEPAARVGEHVVKAICQVCHDALPGAERQPLDKAIVTLSQMPDRFSVREFVRKVRAGSPNVGDPKGRMPRFDYLSDAEIEAAYVYLAAYPPQAE